ncbi:tRNA (guanosine(46)-N7)-methyltransferase TrmB [Streptomyces physcomitrii]|uniref:tRNA (guanosine(46)-N7)-methyltransferase TrmB n=1 Tax=Streptomyces physcomitrii TaxID=2724184 RepID=UPI0028AA4E29|nr:tRNA (guanosine(46)-N7)-methyltransferase TrmB [Streptomyces physcomitrii]
MRAEQRDRPEQAEQSSQADPTTATGATAEADPSAEADPAATTIEADPDPGAAATATATAGRRPPRARKFPEGPAPDPAGSHFERRIRSFQPRRSRVTPGQADALRRLWPLWGFDIDGQRTLDPAAMFEGRPVVLEIGFGMGEATAQMAAADPDTGILAVDVHTPGQGNLLGLAERAGLRNLRVANGDAIILLRAMLPPASLDGLRVFFPDPWPKKRHHKRRLIQPEFLSLAAGVLKPGALLHCATDWEPYAEQMLEVLTAHPDYANTLPDGGYAPRPAFRPLTRFEGQGMDKGHRVHDLLFCRVER